MTIKIEKKIKGYSVVKPEEKTAAAPAPADVAPVAAPVQVMHESIERPDALVGSTYKIKTPMIDHALYVTINDIVLNPGTAHEQRRPFEIFINSKAMDQFQWIVGLTRIMSAVFRKGGDVVFLVEEMKAVFDPHGGYWKPGGVFMPSLVAEIGATLERHLKFIGLIEAPELSDSQRQLIADKRAAYDAAQAPAAAPAASSEGSFPPTATLCAKCNTKALVLMDGCQTCLNCGYSKCG